MRRVLFTLLGFGIYGLLILAGSLLYVEQMDVRWQHQNDTPMTKLDDTEQWVCVTDGTPGFTDWCTQASWDEDGKP